ncbi:MAG TPA: hypothetical protein VKW06_00445 [Candidatus Angelobacter sp.]|nr:hypothetical protein [Candidatus Angelobacter sp.]
MKRSAALEVEIARSLLRLCNGECGCSGGSICGRMIAKDGSVWPARDTGFRMKKAA